VEAELALIAWRMTPPSSLKTARINFLEFSVAAAAFAVNYVFVTATALMGVSCY
jgi:hypothetical protein